MGERIYVYDAGGMLCELCRSAQRETPARSVLMHGPEFGHTMRTTGRRAA